MRGAHGFMRRKMHRALRRRRVAHDGYRALPQFRETYRRIARMIARRLIPIFVMRAVFKIHDHMPQIFKWREERAFRAEYHGYLAIANCKILLEVFFG